MKSHKRTKEAHNFEIYKDRVRTAFETARTAKHSQWLHLANLFLAFRGTVLGTFFRGAVSGAFSSEELFLAIAARFRSVIANFSLADSKIFHPPQSSMKYY